MWMYLAVSAALLHSLTQAIYLEPCQSDPRLADRYVDIVRGQDSTTLYCRGLSRRHTVTWTVAGKRVGRCPNPSPSLVGRKVNSCVHKHFRPAIKPVRTSTYFSSLTVQHAGVANWSFAESDRVVCSTDQSDTASCLINYVYPGQVSRCQVEVKRWGVEGECHVTQVYSSLHHYHCDWFLHYNESERSPLPQISELRLNSDVSSGDLLSGTCRLGHNDFPRGHGPIRYSVRHTGNVTVTPRLLGNSVIERPTRPRISCQPQGPIAVGSSLSCLCTAASLGAPTGRLQWTQLRGDGGASVPGPRGQYGDTVLELGPRILILGDHNTSFRCDVIWARNVTGPAYDVRMEASPRGVQLETNGVHRPRLTLKEGKTVRWRCKVTGSWPVNTTTLTLTRDEGSSPGETMKVRTGGGDLEHRVKGAQCGQAGRYVCRAASYTEASRSLADFCWLYVLCRPRLVDSLRPVLYIHHSPSSVRFDVIAYPLPRDVTVTFVGQASGGEEEDEEEEGGEGREGALTAWCEQGEAIHQASCHVTVARGSSMLAQGFYDVIVSNSEGRVKVTVQVVSGEISTAMAMATTDSDDLLATGERVENGAPTSHPPSPPTPSWRVTLTVAAVVAAAVVVMVVMVVGAICVWRRRRGNGTPDSKQPRPPHILTTELAASFRTGGEMSDVYIYPGLPSSPGYHTAVGMNTEAERGSAAHVYSEVIYYENAPHSHNWCGPEGGEGGVYEGLRMDDLHQPSLYSRLKH